MPIEHLLAGVRLTGFAPSFTLSLGESEHSRKPSMLIATFVIGNFRKKNSNIKWKSKNTNYQIGRAHV